MEEETIVYRPYREEDFDELTGIVRAVWGYDRIGSEKKAKYAAQIDLLDCLRTCTFSEVAVREGKPVGFLLGELAGSPADYRYDGRIRMAERALTGPVGGLLLMMQKKLKKICRQFLHDNGVPYDARLSYFALREDCQGLGAGRTLFEDFMGYLRRERAENFYVFTDTECNYGFYEHMGMVRRQTKSIRLPLVRKSLVELYLYDGAVPKE